MITIKQLVTRLLPEPWSYETAPKPWLFAFLAAPVFLVGWIVFGIGVVWEIQAGGGPSAEYSRAWFALKIGWYIGVVSFIYFGCCGIVFLFKLLKGDYAAFTSKLASKNRK